MVFDMVSRRINRAGYFVRFLYSVGAQLTILRKALQKELDKQNGIKTQGRNPQPIQADIVKDIFSVALSSGVIGEQEYCKAMKIKPSEINAFRYL